MPIEILMPALSPTMTEGNLAKWVKKEGDKVAPGDVIAEIETDKATMEVEAVDEGELGKILVQEGTENVAVNKVIALLLLEGEDKKEIANYKPAESESPEMGATEEAGEVTKVVEPQGVSLSPAAPTGSPASTQTSTKAPKAPVIKDSGRRLSASPLAKRMAEELGVNLARISGTGPKGRIIKADVEDAMLGGATGGAVRRNETEFFQVPNNNMRKVIARRLVESKQQVPHFYLTIDCEIDRLLEARKVLNAEAATKAGKDKEPAYKISVNDMVLKAVALGMRDIPAVNSSWYDDACIRYNNVDVSVAVAIDGGLVTPVLKNADQKSLAQISNEVKALAAKARDGKLLPEEMQGGGFSVSNLGMYGIKEFAAIINPPQSCILAVGAGESRVVVKNGEMLPATIMNVTLSVDHRVVDGALGAQFLAAFKRYIEEPILMFV